MLRWRERAARSPNDFFNWLLAQIKRQASAESRRIPDWHDLGAVNGLRSEAADAERTAFVNNGRIFAEAAIDATSSTTASTPTRRPECFHPRIR